ILRQHDILSENDGIAGKMGCLLSVDVDQFGDMMADGPLPVFIKGGRIPNYFTIRQRAEAGVQVIKTVLDQFHRNHEAVQHLTNPPVGTDVGTKAVAAEKNRAGKQRITFALEEQVLRQVNDFVSMLDEPLFKEWFLAAPLLETKIAADELPVRDEAGVGGKYHVRQPRLRGD